MNKFALCALASALLLLPGCIRSKVELTVNGDNTATIKNATSVKTEAIEAIKGFIEASGAEGGDGISNIQDMADEKKMVREMKETGIEITSSKAISEGGWKGAQVEGKIADVNEWVKKSAAKAKEKAEDSDTGLAGGMDRLSPRFFKTDKEGVGRIRIMQANFSGMPAEMDLDEVDDETREAIQSQIDVMGAMFGLQEMSMEMIVTLPGKVIETKGCKKAGENKVSFAMKGTDMNVDGMKTMFGLKDGVSATFEIPEGCKIRFEDPAVKPEPKPAKDEAAEEKGKGGLRIR